MFSEGSIMESIVRNIEWIRPEDWDDRLILRVGNSVIERADGHVVIRGKIYAYVLNRTMHSWGTDTHHSTYVVGSDGVAKKAVSTGGMMLHYKVVNGSVILESCRSDVYAGRGRHGACSLCKAAA